MVRGRPPKLFSKEDCEKLGKDLLHWVQNEGSSKIAWVDWYCIKHHMFRGDWRALVQREEFLPYYEPARKIMVSNLMQNKDLPQSYGNRYLALLDDELLDHEESIKDRQAKRDQKDKVEVSVEEWTKLQALLSSLKERVSESPKTEEKSSC